MHDLKQPSPCWDYTCTIIQLHWHAVQFCKRTTVLLCMCVCVHEDRRGTIWQLDKEIEVRGRSAAMTSWTYLWTHILWCVGGWPADIRKSHTTSSGATTKTNKSCETSTEWCSSAGESSLLTELLIKGAHIHSTWQHQMSALGEEK